MGKGTGDPAKEPLYGHTSYGIFSTAKCSVENVVLLMFAERIAAEIGTTRRGIARSVRKAVRATDAKMSS